MIYEGGSVVVLGVLNIVSFIRKEKIQIGKVVYFIYSYIYGVGELFLNFICKILICVLYGIVKKYMNFVGFFCIFFCLYVEWGQLVWGCCEDYMR